LPDQHHFAWGFAHLKALLHIESRRSQIPLGIPSTQETKT
jgi:hypothetical protein